MCNVYVYMHTNKHTQRCSLSCSNTERGEAGIDAQAVILPCFFFIQFIDNFS